MICMSNSILSSEIKGILLTHDRVAEIKIHLNQTTHFTLASSPECLHTYNYVWQNGTVTNLGRADGV